MAREQTLLLPVVGLVMACTLGLSAALVQVSLCAVVPAIIFCFASTIAVCMSGSCASTCDALPETAQQLCLNGRPASACHMATSSQKLRVRICALQLANSGPPPDVVGVWVDDSDVGAIATDGSFIYQSATIGQAPYIGRYLSYQ